MHVHFDEVEHAILTRQDDGDIPPWQAAAVKGEGAAPVDCWVAQVWESSIVFSTLVRQIGIHVVAQPGIQADIHIWGPPRILTSRALRGCLRAPIPRRLPNPDLKG